MTITGNNLGQGAVNALCNQAAYSMPTTVYVALSTTDPVDRTGADVTEPTNAGYARLQITAGHFGNADSSNRADVTADLDWAQITGGSPFTVLALAFYTASTGGTFLWSYTLPTPTQFSSGQIPSIPASSSAYVELP